MRYLDIYNKLTEVENKSVWNRIRLTFQIARCSPAIFEQIYNYLDTGEQPEYSLNLTFTDPSTQRQKTSVVSCKDIQDNLNLKPLPALLYLDWLRREPCQASTLFLIKDNIKLMPTDEFRAYVDPKLLAQADEIIKRKEKEGLRRLQEEI